MTPETHERLKHLAEVNAGNGLGDDLSAALALIERLPVLDAIVERAMTEHWDMASCQCWFCRAARLAGCRPKDVYLHQRFRFGEHITESAAAEAAAKEGLPRRQQDDTGDVPRTWREGGEAVKTELVKKMRLPVAVFRWGETSWGEAIAALHEIAEAAPDGTFEAKHMKSLDKLRVKVHSKMRLGWEGMPDDPLAVKK